MGLGVSDVILSDCSSSDLYTSSKNVFDSSIYRMLQMQGTMKILSLPSRVKSEFDVFLVIGESLMAGGTVSSNYLAFNEYLGSLGVE